MHYQFLGLVRELTKLRLWLQTLLPMAQVLTRPSQGLNIFFTYWSAMPRVSRNPGIVHNSTISTSWLEQRFWWKILNFNFPRVNMRRYLVCQKILWSTIIIDLWFSEFSILLIFCFEILKLLSLRATNCTASYLLYNNKN